MNNLRIEMTISNKTYVEKYETSLNAKELSKVIRENKYFLIEESDIVTIYNFDNVDVLKIIQE